MFFSISLSLFFISFSFWFSFPMIEISFLSASFSISKFIIFLCASSNTGGLFSRAILREDDASSIKSTALSGKNLFVIYLADKFTAETIASSVIRTP